MGNAIVIGVVALLVVLVLWRNHKKGAPCVCGCNCGKHGDKHSCCGNGECHCHDK